MIKNYFFVQVPLLLAQVAFFLSQAFLLSLLQHFFSLLEEQVDCAETATGKERTAANAKAKIAFIS